MKEIIKVLIVWITAVVMLFLVLVIMFTGRDNYININKVIELQNQKEQLEIENNQLEKILEANRNKELSIVEVETEIKTFTISAYNTVVWQTDDSPCISASGKYICGRDDIIACPAKYKFGTRIQILDKIYICEDRMKNDGGIDISFDKDIAGAINWGRKQLTIIILK